MSEEDQADEKLERYEEIINDKMDNIRRILQEEDRSIVEEIVMKKSHSTDPSTSPLTQSTPSTTRRIAITRSFGRSTSSTKS